MKKYLSLLMLLMMLPTLALADPIALDEEALAAEEARLYQEMERRSIIALKEIEDNREAIDEQIEASNRKQVNKFCDKNSTYTGFKYQEGDLLITKNNPSHGFQGHVGVVVNDLVLDIPNTLEPPYRKLSLEQWYRDCPSTMVLRYHNGTYLPIKTSWFGESFFIIGEKREKSATFRMGGLYADGHDYETYLLWDRYPKNNKYKHEIRIKP